MLGGRSEPSDVAEGVDLSALRETDFLELCGERLTVESATRRLSILSRLEESYNKEVVHDYIQTIQYHGMNEAWRSKIVTWFHQLGDAFKLSPTTLSYAMSFLDRYLSKRSCSGVNYQLVSVAALFLAAKIEEPKPVTTADFVALSENVFDAEDVRTMELELVCALKWQLHPPPAALFVELVAALLPVGARALSAADVSAVAATATDYAARSIFDVRFLAYRASMIAVAATICACKRRGVGARLVDAWMRRLRRADLAYTREPCSQRRILECGDLLFRLIEPLSDAAPRPPPVSSTPPPRPDHRSEPAPKRARSTASLSSGDLADLPDGYVALDSPPPPDRQSPNDVSADVAALPGAATPKADGP